MGGSSLLVEYEVENLYSVFDYQEYLGVKSLLVSEDLVEGFSFPSEDHGEDQTSLVKV